MPHGPPAAAASRAEGMRRSRKTTRRGGAQTKKREASMLATKKRVFAHLQARHHSFSLFKTITVALFNPSGHRLKMRWRSEEGDTKDKCRRGAFG